MTDLPATRVSRADYWYSKDVMPINVFLDEECPVYAGENIRT